MTIDFLQLPEFSRFALDVNGAADERRDAILSFAGGLLLPTALLPSFILTADYH